MENLQVGSKVHYMQSSGDHSDATVTRVGVDGVVDLHVKDGDSNYDRKTVAYREQPTAYSWHWPEQ